MSHINWNWKKKYCTGTCLIDKEKAFDNIWLPGLIYKLIDYNSPRQGTVMAPTLFSICTLKLLNQIENIISFADDILIYNSGDTISHINSNLQVSFDLVETYAENWHLKINAEKCETILFRPVRYLIL